MDMATLALAFKRIKQHESAVQKVEVSGQSLVFTFTDGTSDTMTFPSPESTLGLHLDDDGDIAQMEDDE